MRYSSSRDASAGPPPHPLLAPPRAQGRAVLRGEVPLRRPAGQAPHRAGVADAGRLGRLGRRAAAAWPTGTSTSGVRTWPLPSSSRTYVKDFNESERVERERRTRGVTFRELAHGYLEWLEKVRGAKPSTIRSHQSDLAEPGTPHKRGTGTTAGLIMAALGDRPAAKITPAEVEALLRTVAATGVSARSVNRAREIVCAAFNYGMKPTTYSLPTNPALGTDRRRVPEPGVLLFYSPEEIEAIARSLAGRLPPSRRVGPRRARALRGRPRRRGGPRRRLLRAPPGRAPGVALAGRRLDRLGAHDQPVAVLRRRGDDQDRTRPARADGRPGRGRTRPALTAPGFRLPRRLRLLQRPGPAAGRLGAPPPLQAGPRRRRAAPAPLARPPPHVRIAARRRRRRPREHQGRHGALAADHHEPVPPRPPGNRTRGRVHRRVRRQRRHGFVSPRRETASSSPTSRSEP